MNDGTANVVIKSLLDYFYKVTSTGNIAVWGPLNSAGANINVTEVIFNQGDSQI